MRSGGVVSCGCYQKERTVAASTTHGATGTPEYSRWAHMIARCEDPSSEHFDRYGGRGIVICERWRRDFSAFLADMGPLPSPKHSIERLRNDGNYEPGNCEWVTVKAQARNKSNNRVIVAFGQSKCLAEWAEAIGISPTSLAERIDRGWSPERAVSKPPRALSFRRIVQ